MLDEATMNFVELAPMKY